MNELNAYPLISIDESLARVGGRKPLLIKLLNAYIANPRKDEFVSAFAAKDMEAAGMVLHTIKGVAANLSLTRLTKCMEHLEGVYKESKANGSTDLFDKTDHTGATAIIDDTIAEVAVAMEALK